MVRKRRRRDLSQDGFQGASVHLEGGGVDAQGLQDGAQGPRDVHGPDGAHGGKKRRQHPSFSLSLASHTTNARELKRRSEVDLPRESISTSQWTVHRNFKGAVEVQQWGPRPTRATRPADPRFGSAAPENPLRDPRDPLGAAPGPPSGPVQQWLFR